MDKILTRLFALAVICLGGAAVYYLSAATLRAVGEVSPNVGAAIIAAVVTAAVALYNQRTARLREIAESHRPQKVELYNVFMDIIDTTMDLSRRGQLGQMTGDSAPAKLEELIQTFRRGLVVWASPEVIRAWESMRSSGDQGFEMLRKSDSVFRAIRKDLGNSNRGLDQGALVKLFLKDPGEYDRLLGKTSRSTS
jgi:hypothetical protein